MFLPENIDLAHAENYDLSIRLTPDRFSFCIYSVNDPTIFHYQETGLGSKFTYTESIKRLIFDLGFFSQPFRSTRATVVSPQFTLVPGKFFDRKRAKTLFQYNFHETEGKILSDSLLEGIHIVYHLDEEVHSFLSRNLWDPHFRHQATSLLSMFATHAAERCDRCCFVDFHDQFVSLFAFDEGLLTANMFPATHPQDTLYYITNAWEKLAFDQTADSLLLSGNLDTHTEVIEELSKFIAKVEQTELHPKTNLSEEQRRTLPTDILAILCES
ncbi:MAG: DUF3822 family protein [Fermentimonas sp.]|jgi:hypothetical protein